MKRDLGRAGPGAWFDRCLGQGEPIGEEAAPVAASESVERLRAAGELRPPDARSWPCNSGVVSSDADPGDHVGAAVGDVVKPTFKSERYPK